MTLHPQAKVYLEQLAAKRGPSWPEIPVEEGRRLFNGLDIIFGSGPELHSVEDGTVDAADPARSIPIRIYRPSDAVKATEAAETADPQPVIVYFHGGGWVVGNLDTHDAVCRRLAQTSGWVVISVDYRLAPEHPYPAALDDAYAATCYMAEHADRFGVDPERLVVAGDSAGGNLAAAVAMKSRDCDGPQILRQVLIYPVIEPDFATASYAAFGEEHGLTRETMEWFWNQYVPADTTADLRYVRLGKADAHNLPPAFVLTAEYDVLRDEGELFVERLQQAGVSVVFKRYPGMLHGFVHFAAMFDDAETAVRDIAAFLPSD